MYNYTGKKRATIANTHTSQMEDERQMCYFWDGGFRAGEYGTVVAASVCESSVVGHCFECEGFVSNR